MYLLFLTKAAVRKLLMALKQNVFKDELLLDLVDVLRVLVGSNFSVDVIRGLATFLVSTLSRSTFDLYNRR